jgi:hypothetical protein
MKIDSCELGIEREAFGFELSVRFAVAPRFVQIPSWVSSFTVTLKDVWVQMVGFKTRRLAWTASWSGRRRFVVQEEEESYLKPQITTLPLLVVDPRSLAFLGLLDAIKVSSS